MHFAARLSVAVTGIDATFPATLCRALQQYGLPAKHSFDEAAIAFLQSDKKRRGQTLDFILLQAPGKAVIKALPLEFVADQLRLFAHES
jgi:3-dehydroquinate synthetase